MDRETLLAHRMLWVADPDRCEKDLPRLTPPEQEIYQDLRCDSTAGSYDSTRNASPSATFAEPGAIAPLRKRGVTETFLQAYWLSFHEQNHP
jgi:hypothetical protein